MDETARWVVTLIIGSVVGPALAFAVGVGMSRAEKATLKQQVADLMTTVAKMRDGMMEAAGFKAILERIQFHLDSLKAEVSSLKDRTIVLETMLKNMQKQQEEEREDRRALTPVHGVDYLTPTPPPGPPPGPPRRRKG